MARTVGLAGGLSGGKRALVVDWGYSNTTLCIAGDDRPLYSRRIHDCAFGCVVEAIANGLDVTLDEAADILKVSRATAYRMVSAGVLPAQQLCTGAPWIIRLADLRDDAVCRDAEARRSRRPISQNPLQNSLAL